MKVKYLSWIRNRVGLSEEEFATPAGLITISDFIECMAGRDEKYKFLLEYRGVISVSVNGNLVQDWNDVHLNDADEVVLFSPLAGG